MEPKRSPFESRLNTRKHVVDYRQNQQPFQQQYNPQFSYNHHRDCPPRPPPDFCIVIHAERSEIEGLKANLKVRPDSFVFDSDMIAGIFSYSQWVDVLETILHLWEYQLNGVHMFTPRLEGKLLLPSDRNEFTDRLKKMIVEHVEGLSGGELVKNWEMKLRMLEDVIKKQESLRRQRRPTAYALFYMIQEKVEMLGSEKELVERRIKEFKWRMDCIIEYLTGKVNVDTELKAIKLNGDFDWGKIHCLILRECRRLDDGLPISASRQDILRNIHCQQVVI